ncbi:MAG: hypothetical protein N2C14_33170, partial [Planctomycetales bacterium]
MLYFIGENQNPYHSGVFAWSLAERKSVRLRTIPKNFLSAVAVSPVGNRIAVRRAYGNGVLILDANTLETVSTIKDDDAYSFAFSKDGKRLATSRLHGVNIWNVETGRLEAPLDAAERVAAIRFSNQGKFLWSVHGGHVVQCWNVKTGEEQSRWHVPVQERVARRESRYFDFCEQVDDVFLAIHERSSLTVFDVKKRKTLRTVDTNGSRIGCSLSGDGASVAFVSTLESIIKTIEDVRSFKDVYVLSVCDVRTGKRSQTTRKMTVKREFHSAKIALSRNGKLLAAGSTIWNVATGEHGPRKGLQHRDLYLAAARFVTDSPSEPAATALYHGLNGEFVMGFEDGTVIFHDALPRSRQTFTDAYLIEKGTSNRIDLRTPQQNPVQCLALSRDGKYLAA